MSVLATLPSQILAELAESPEEGRWQEVACPVKLNPQQHAGLQEVTGPMLEEMVRNFSGKVDIPVDYDHLSTKPITFIGQGRAAGWIKRLKTAVNAAGQKTLLALIEWNQAARDLIGNKEYRYLSPTIAFNYLDKLTHQPVGTKLVAVGLVNRPWIEALEAQLADVNALPFNERHFRLAEALKAKFGDFYADVNGAYLVDAYDDKVLFRQNGKLYEQLYELGDGWKITFSEAPSEVVMVPKRVSELHEDPTMSDKIVSLEEFNAAIGRLTSLEEKITTQDAKIVALTDSNTTLMATNAALVKQGAEAEAGRVVDDLIRATKLRKPQRDNMIKICLSDRPWFDEYVKTLVPLHEIAEEHGSGDGTLTDDDPTGAHGESGAVAQLDEEVEKYLTANPGKKYKDAIHEVQTKNPGLVERRHKAFRRQTANSTAAAAE